MLGVIDSHCHLELADFRGDENARAATIERARQAGVAHFVVVGSGASLANVENAVALAHAHPDMSAAIAVHPHDASRLPASALEEIERLAATDGRICAIGETGLDYHYHHSPPEAQQEVFRRFIALARRLGKPLTLHVREAHDDARRILIEEEARDVPIVVHCFTGTLDDARAYLDLGCFLSFSGVLTFRSADEIRRAARFAPADRALVETDSPYLAPEPHRGKKNEPAYVVEVLRALAALRSVPLEQAAADTASAARRALRLDNQNPWTSLDIRSDGG